MSDTFIITKTALGTGTATIGYTADGATSVAVSPSPVTTTVTTSTPTVKVAGVTSRPISVAPPAVTPVINPPPPPPAPAVPVIQIPVATRTFFNDTDPLYNSGDVDTVYSNGGWQNYIENSIFMRQETHCAGYIYQWLFNNGAFGYTNYVLLPTISGEWWPIIHVAAENRLYAFGLGTSTTINSVLYYRYLFVSTSTDNGNTWSAVTSFDMNSTGWISSNITWSHSAAYGVILYFNRPYGVIEWAHINKTMTLTLLGNVGHSESVNQIAEKKFITYQSTSVLTEFKVYEHPTVDAGVMTLRGTYNISQTIDGNTSVYADSAASHEVALPALFFNGALHAVVKGNGSNNNHYIINVENNNIVYSLVPFAINEASCGRFMATRPELSTFEYNVAITNIHVSKGLSSNGLVVSTDGGITWGNSSYPFTEFMSVPYRNYENSKTRIWNSRTSFTTSSFTVKKDGSIYATNVAEDYRTTI